MSKILIVDDDLANRDILRCRLENAGFEVLEATNGEEGLKAISDNPPDLVILDVMMPMLDGWNVCRKLKEHAETRTIPIVMLTARTLEIEQLRGWEAGVNEYLTKPCDPQHLLKVISSLLANAPNGV